MQPLGLLFLELRTAKELLAETLNLPDDGGADAEVTNVEPGNIRRGKYQGLCSGSRHSIKPRLIVDR